MNKRWLPIIILILVIAPLAWFSLSFKNQEIEDSSYEISNLKLSEFDEIFIDFPSKAATSFKKINGYWYQTKPYQTRADQNIVYRFYLFWLLNQKKNLNHYKLKNMV